MLDLPLVCYSSCGSQWTILLTVYPTQILTEWTPAVNPSHSYLINSDSCIQYHLFLPWKGKRNPFSSQLTIFHTLLKKSTTVVLLVMSRKTLLYEQSHCIYRKKLTSALKQENESTFSCPTSIWVAAISAASLPLAPCQYVELLLCLLSLLHMSSLLALPCALALSLSPLLFKDTAMLFISLILVPLSSQYHFGANHRLLQLNTMQNFQIQVAPGNLWGLTTKFIKTRSSCARL